MADFQTFDIGNVLANVERIQGARDRRTQANALLERNAQGQVLLQNALKEIDLSGNTSGPAFNALLGFDLGAANELQDVFNERQDQQRQELEQKRQDERDINTKITRAALHVMNAKDPLTALKIGFPGVLEKIAEEAGIPEDQITNEAIVNDFGPQLLAKFGPNSDVSLKELGIEKPKFVSPSGKEAADRRRIVAGGDAEELRRFDEDAARNKALVSINTQTTAAEEAAKGVGKIQAESFGKQLAARDEAQSQNLALFRASELIDRIETQGPGAATLQGVKAFAKGFLGLDLGDLGLAEDVEPAEALATISARMALRLRNPASGLGLTGNTSDKDLAFLKSIPPSIGKTKGGNKLVIKWMILVNNRKIRNGNVAEQFQRQFGVGGTDDEGRSLNQAVAADNEANPIFGDEDTKILELVKRLGL